MIKDNIDEFLEYLDAREEDNNGAIVATLTSDEKDLVIDALVFYKEMQVI